MSTIRVQKPTVLAQVPASGHVLIEASAGTGKTFTIEHLVLDLLLTTDAKLDEILVVTFTEKATLELRSRVREAIERFLVLDRDSLDDENAAHWVIDERARAKLRAALDSFDTASISTIHGFCQSVLRDRAFASRRLFAEEQISFDDAFTRAFYDALRGDFATNPELKRALDAWLVGGNTVAKLEETLREVSKRKGTIELAFDADRALEAARVCLAAIGTWSPKLNLKTKTGQEDKEHLDNLRACIEKGLSTNDAFLIACENELATGDIAHLLKRTQDLASLPLDIKEAFAALGRHMLHEKAVAAKFFLPVVQKRMEERKRLEGLYDFDDMLMLVREALRGEGGDGLRETLRKQYRVALIDEFQDTDNVQWEIFQRIFFDAREGHRLFLVGDPKQAIYGFRGADIAAYRRACEEVQKHGGELLRLAHNFRSSARMIAAAHRIFGEGTDFFTGDNRYDVPVSVGANPPSLIDAQGRELPAFLVEDFSIDPPTSSRAIKARSANAIADEIERLLDPKNGILLKARSTETRPLRPSDIFVLTFKVSESLSVGRVLRERAIPYAFFKADGLFQTDEARDLRDLLAAIEKPGDRGRVARALLTPFFGFSLDELGRDLPSGGEHPAAIKLSAWRSLIDDKSYAAFFSAIVEESGLIRRCVFDDNERALTNYQQLIEQLQAQAQRSRSTIAELVRLLSSYISEQERPPEEAADMQRLQSDRDAVQVMTVHKSKGLEAAVVFLFGGYRDKTSEDFYTYREDGQRKVWPGRPPEHIKQKYKSEREEETQRLLYVALTRAKARFVLHYYGAKPSGWNGLYLALHSSLGRLRDENSELFEWRMSSGAHGRAKDSLGGAATKAFANWPPDFVFDDASSRVSALKIAHRAPLMTSYSRIARAKSKDEGMRTDDRATELARTEPLVVPALELLPPGITTGLFLHELLELVDIDALRSVKSLQALRADEGIRALINDVMESYAIDKAHRAHAESILFDAMKRPLALGEQRIECLAHATRHLREPEFVYPIPESSHPLLANAPEHGKRFTVERGYVKGYIDLIFEHEGRSYVLDWKSDTLPSYDAESVRAHAEAEYGVQARLYAVALVRMLRIKTRETYERLFGGLVYFFLRSSGEQGVYFRRPSFEELGAWERELVAREQWG